MPLLDRVAASSDHLSHLRHLVFGRWCVLGTLAVASGLAPVLLAVPLPQIPLAAILLATAAFNAIVQWRLRGASHASAGELLSQLLFDIASLSALVFFSGGATNPLVSLLLPPVAIAALTLPAAGVFAVGASAIGAYSLLMVVYLPLPIADAGRATRLHLGGMWLIFTVSAAMIGWLIVRMTHLIRERDAALAAAREQALRDERVVAMGTLAAGAAHELGTPLGTMALLAGELARDASLAAPVREDIELLRRQIGLCKEIISQLAQRAGAARLESAPRQSAERWLETLRQHWHAVRPQAASRLVLTSDLPAPSIVADPRLEQAILNLLNNAAQATPRPLELRLGWSSRELCIDIRDHGPGFPPAVLAQGGQSSFPAHADGCGVGLMLTRSAIEQLGGRLTLSNPDEGGALARIELPLTTS